MRFSKPPFQMKLLKNGAYKFLIPANSILHRPASSHSALQSRLWCIWPPKMNLSDFVRLGGIRSQWRLIKTIFFFQVPGYPLPLSCLLPVPYDQNALQLQGHRSCTTGPPQLQVRSRVSQMSTFVKSLTGSGLIWFSEGSQVPWYHFLRRTDLLYAMRINTQKF